MSLTIKFVRLFFVHISTQFDEILFVYNELSNLAHCTAFEGYCS
jgi:hypothetical protein